MVEQACRVEPPVADLACVRPVSAPAEIGELYTQYFDLVWRNLRRLGVEDATLDDAVQDVFLVVHRRIKDFLGRSSIKTWIVGIVLRVARDYRRSQQRHTARVARYAEQHSVTCEGECPAEQVALREAAAMVNQIVGGFSAEERDVFVLVELEELSLRQTAEATGMSLSTCQRRLLAARKSFNAAIRRHERALDKGVSP